MGNFRGSCRNYTHRPFGWRTYFLRMRLGETLFAYAPLDFLLADVLFLRRVKNRFSSSNVGAISQNLISCLFLAKNSFILLVFDLFRFFIPFFQDGFDLFSGIIRRLLVFVAFLNLDSLLLSLLLRSLLGKFKKGLL